MSYYDSPLRLYVTVGSGDNQTSHSAVVLRYGMFPTYYRRSSYYSSSEEDALAYARLAMDSESTAKAMRQLLLRGKAPFLCSQKRDRGYYNTNLLISRKTPTSFKVHSMRFNGRNVTVFDVHWGVFRFPDKSAVYTIPLLSDGDNGETIVRFLEHLSDEPIPPTAEFGRWLLSQASIRFRWDSYDPALFHSFSPYYNGEQQLLTLRADKLPEYIIQFRKEKEAK